MHDHPVLIFTALLIFIYGLFSKLSERSVITGPMVFMAIGVLVSPMVLGLFELHIKTANSVLESRKQISNENQSDKVQATLNDIINAIKS